MKSEEEIKDTLNYIVKQLGRGDTGDLVLSGMISALSFVLEEPPFNKSVATMIKEGLVNYIERNK